MLLRLAFVCTAFLAVAPPAAAQTLSHPTLTSGDMRGAIDLDGRWTWSVDPFRDGLRAFHGSDPGPSSRRYNDIDVGKAMQRDPAALYEYDMDRSATIMLPQSFVTHSPQMRYYKGLVWYQRHLIVHVRAGERAFLRFGAVDYRAHVYLNGKSLGEHEGGFTPFAFEVTSLLRDGDNRLTVGADSERNPGDVPPVVTDWENYGGITRPVALIFVPSTYVDDAWVRLTRNGRIAATVKLDGPGAATREVRVRIPALGFVL